MEKDIKYKVIPEAQNNFVLRDQVVRMTNFSLEDKSWLLVHFRGQEASESSGNLLLFIGLFCYLVLFSLQHYIIEISNLYVFMTYLYCFFALVSLFVVISKSKDVRSSFEQENYSKFTSLEFCYTFFKDRTYRWGIILTNFAILYLGHINTVPMAFNSAMLVILSYVFLRYNTCRAISWAIYYQKQIKN